MDIRRYAWRSRNVRFAGTLDGIDLAIRHGEVFGILGPNGAGKSTTVEILQGNRTRDGGDVAVLGTDPASAGRAWRSRVGIVWQDESAPAELTVRETVRQFARYYPRPRDPEGVIALVGLPLPAGRRSSLRRWRRVWWTSCGLARSGLGCPSARRRCCGLSPTGVPTPTSAVVCMSPSRR